MPKSKTYRFLPVDLLGVCLLVAFISAHSGATDFARTQTLQLEPGWNAVYLEIDPNPSNPRDAFNGTPVDIIAGYTPAVKGAQFVRNPNAAMLSAYGWAIWYAPTRADAFLSNLYQLYGGKSFLVHATTNATITLTGTTPLEKPTWTPNAYNFIGFSLADPGAPTFKQFFGGSPDHDHNQIYRLVEGTWRQVLDPTNTVMKSGEAFWIFCRGRSDYPGPLETSTRIGFGLQLNSVGGGDVVFRNRTKHPVSFSVEHLTAEGQPVPISTPVMAIDEETGGLRTVSAVFDPTHFEQAFPALEPGEAIRLPLELRLNEAMPGTHHSLLKVTSDLGTITYIPITSTRDAQ